MASIISPKAEVSPKAKIGDNCKIYPFAYIEDDCVIGNGVIYSTSVVENAKTRVGDLAMIQAGTTFSKDIPPYIIAGGKPVKYAGPNTIIMEAAEVTEKVRKHIANAYRLVFHGQTSLFDAINQIKDQVPDGPEIQNIIQFLESSEKGVITKM